MEKKITSLLILAIGVYFVCDGVQTWHFKLSDTTLFPPFSPPIDSIVAELIYGIGLISLSYISFKKLKITTDLCVVLLSFSVFNQVQYFYQLGFVFWLVGMIILLTNVSIVYKIIVVLMYIIWFLMGVQRLDYHFIMMVSSIILLLLTIYRSHGSSSQVFRYKMKPMHKLFFGIVLLPYLISIVIS